MSTTVWEQLGVRPVINAAGKMTYLGTSRPSREIAEAMADACGTYVDMTEAKRAVARRVAELVDAPAAWVVASAAAGIVSSVAGCITGTELADVESVPHVATSRRRVVLASGHAVHFGAPIVQMVRLGGGEPVLVGQANRTTLDHYRAALDSDTAAVLYVVSHHASEGVPSLAEVVETAHDAGTSVIVDAAAEVDLHRYVGSGADLVVYSGHKAIASPTSGLVLGSQEAVARVAAQEVGVGRAMKVGKETLAGILVAVERYVGGLTDLAEDDLHRVLDEIHGQLTTDQQKRTTRVSDGTRPIPRLRLLLDSESAARDLIRRLETGVPPVRTRNHGASQGYVDLDPRELSLDEARRLGDILAAQLPTVAS